MANGAARQTIATTSPILRFICDPASIGNVIEIAITAVFEKKVGPVLVIEKDVHLRRTGDMTRNDGCIIATIKTQLSHGQQRVLAGAPRPPVVPTIPACGAMSRRRVFDPG
jgi:hypothetical protein